ncbi:efflux transporter outer membrane subunit [Candidatus Binatia bacterium]|nr:efflux transporter outer membrane subunit [Candidatus Binatia bacterium]
MRLTILLLAAAFLASACAVGPDYVRPDPPLPSGWQTDPPGFAVVPGSDVGRWWNAFDDAELSSLVERATIANKDLMLAAARVAEAQALYRATRSAEFPSIDSDAGVDYERSSVNALFPGGNDATVWGLGVSASWEVDLFGRVRRSVESSQASFEASDEDRRAVLVAVIAQVASAYVDLRTTQRRLDVARQNLASQGKIVDLTRIRFEGGIASSLDVAQAESIYANTRTFIPPLEAAIARAMNRLSVLLGENPGPLANELAAPAPIPDPPAEMTVALPVDMVRQRPDVRAAERQLAAQTARIGVATADLYPRLTLLGTFGFDATDFKDLFQGPSRSYSVGPALRWNVFDAGRIRALIGAEEARTTQALASYEQTILTSLEEVENALVTYARLRDQRAASIDAIRAATTSLDLATALYKDGLADFQNVLDAQRTLLTYQDQLARVDGDSVQSLVQLYRALGGGWTALEPPPPGDGEPVPGDPSQNADEVGDAKQG